MPRESGESKMLSFIVPDVPPLLRAVALESVTRNVHPGSDVDLAVLLQRAPLDLEKYSRLLHKLERLFPDREADLAV